MTFSDKGLSQKLERAEGRATADFVATRARLDPASGAEWKEFGGTYAMFDGPESPCTQTFGLGIFDEVTPELLEQIEEFFITKGAPVLHEVSPLVDPAVIELLNERNYRPIELTSVMYRQLETATIERSPIFGLRTRIAEPDEAELWARTSAAGWATEADGLQEMMLNFGLVAARCHNSSPFFVELDGEPIGAGSLFIYDDVALMAGASTVPAGRRRGAQNALLAARLKHAADNGCTLAVMAARPGSGSQRNAEKNGFRIAYTRIKWVLTR